MSRAEQETVFRYAADEMQVSVFTAYPPTRRKLTRAGYTPCKVSRQDGQEVGWFFTIPLAEFRWRAGGRRSRPRTAAQQAVSQRLASLQNPARTRETDGA